MRPPCIIWAWLLGWAFIGLASLALSEAVVGHSRLPTVSRPIQSVPHSRPRYYQSHDPVRARQLVPLEYSGQIYDTPTETMEALSPASYIPSSTSEETSMIVSPESSSPATYLSPSSADSQVPSESTQDTQTTVELGSTTAESLPATLTTVESTPADVTTSAIEPSTPASFTVPSESSSAETLPASLSQSLTETPISQLPASTDSTFVMPESSDSSVIPTAPESVTVPESSPGATASSPLPPDQSASVPAPSETESLPQSETTTVATSSSPLPPDQSASGPAPSETESFPQSEMTTVATASSPAVPDQSSVSETGVSDTESSPPPETTTAGTALSSSVPGPDASQTESPSVPGSTNESTISSTVTSEPASITPPPSVTAAPLTVSSTSASVDFAAYGEIFPDGSVWSDEKPYVNCKPPCSINIPPFPLSTPTVITWPPFTTTLFSISGSQSALATVGTTNIAGQDVPLCSASGAKVVVKTTVVTIPPFTTDFVNFWPISVDAATNQVTFTAVPSIIPPEYPLSLSAGEFTAPVSDFSADRVKPTAVLCGPFPLPIQAQPTVVVDLPPVPIPPLVYDTDKPPHPECAPGAKGCGSNGGRGGNSHDCSQKLFGCCGPLNMYCTCGIFSCNGGCSIFGCGGGCGLFGCITVCPLGVCNIMPELPSFPPAPVFNPRLPPPDTNDPEEPETSTSTTDTSVSSTSSSSSCEVITVTNALVSCSSSTCFTTATSVASGCSVTASTSTTSAPACAATIKNISPNDDQGISGTYTMPPYDGPLCNPAIGDANNEPWLSMYDMERGAHEFCFRPPKATTIDGRLFWRAEYGFSMANGKTGIVTYTAATWSNCTTVDPEKWQSVCGGAMTHIEMNCPADEKDDKRSGGWSPAFEDDFCTNFAVDFSVLLQGKAPPGLPGAPAPGRPSSTSSSPPAPSPSPSTLAYKPRSWVIWWHTLSHTASLPNAQILFTYEWWLMQHGFDEDPLLGCDWLEGANSLTQWPWMYRFDAPEPPRGHKAFDEGPFPTKLPLKGDVLTGSSPKNPWAGCSFLDDGVKAVFMCGADKKVVSVCDKINTDIPLCVQTSQKFWAMFKCKLNFDWDTEAGCKDGPCPEPPYDAI